MTSGSPAPAVGAHGRARSNGGQCVGKWRWPVRTAQADGPCDESNQYLSSGETDALRLLPRGTQAQALRACARTPRHGSAPATPWQSAMTPLNSRQIPRCFRWKRRAAGSLLRRAWRWPTRDAELAAHNCDVRAFTASRARVYRPTHAYTSSKVMLQVPSDAVSERPKNGHGAACGHAPSRARCRARTTPGVGCLPHAIGRPAPQMQRLKYNNDRSMCARRASCGRRTLAPTPPCGTAHKHVAQPASRVRTRRRRCPLPLLNIPSKCRSMRRSKRAGTQRRDAAAGTPTPGTPAHPSDIEKADGPDHETSPDANVDIAAQRLVRWPARISSLRRCGCRLADSNCRCWLDAPVATSATRWQPLAGPVCPVPKLRLCYQDSVRHSDRARSRPSPPSKGKRPTAA